MRVDVLPGNFSFSVNAGQTVMAASEAAGLLWPTVCGGEGTCLICVLQIEAGDDRVEAPSEEEMSALTALPARLREAGLPVRLPPHTGQRDRDFYGWDSLGRNTRRSADNYHRHADRIRDCSRMKKRSSRRSECGSCLCTG
jgi:ferredoxin, 2Fe-2S